jgi:parvulin-like peptidyl-prolyl isomerase
MIDNRLIVQKAKELSIKVDERRIKSSAENQINQIRSQYPSPRDFNRALREQGLTITDLQKYYETFLTEQQLIERLIQSEIRSKINLTDSDLIEFYYEHNENIPMKPESYELAAIIRKPTSSSETEADARKRINDIKNRLQRGESFQRLARELSECPSASSGGDLGYFTRGMMVEEFEEVAFRIGINEISDVVRTQFGYHLILVTDKREDEVKANHILIMVNITQDDIEREREMMNMLYSRLENGQDFKEMATEFSHDEKSNIKGGVLGILTHQEYPVAFADRLVSMEVGEFSSVMENAGSFYIFKIISSHPPRPYDFNEIKERINDVMVSRKQTELYAKWMEDLKKEIYVEINTERLKILDEN